MNFVANVGAQCGKYRNLLSNFFDKNLVKATFLLKKLVSRINFSMRVIFSFFHTVENGWPSITLKKASKCQFKRHFTISFSGEKGLKGCATTRKLKLIFHVKWNFHLKYHYITFWKERYQNFCRDFQIRCAYLIWEAVVYTF